MSGKVKQGNKTTMDKNANDKDDAAFKDSDANEKTFPQWDLLTHEQINALLDLTVDEVQTHFLEALGLKNYQTCLKEVAMVDYYVCGFRWAKEMNFSCHQVSFVMAVLQLLLDNIIDKQMSFVENFTKFNRAVTRSLQSPTEADGSPVLDADQAMALTDHLKYSLFQNYRLYEFLFTNSRQELLLGMERTIEVICSDDVVAPLEEGMPAEIYFRFLAPPPMEKQKEEVSSGLEEGEEEPGDTQFQDGEELTSYSVEDVKEVLVEITRGMLGNLKAEFTEKLLVQEKNYSSRLDQLKNTSNK
ncbi:ciliary-associated calcium-binding coiled-coil protein 1 [Osmerus mordax]|uniref:ciliary-associated calcium-binding coiled-coil protein 1 n=1 Tax=Osmerus mordax TaxID=8014 RepID=UPI00350F630B